MDSSGGEPPECRICRDPAPPLLRPCRCASYAHQACLRQWVASRSAAFFPLTFSHPAPSCEVCLSPYMPAAAPPEKKYAAAQTPGGDGPAPPAGAPTRPGAGDAPGGAPFQSAPTWPSRLARCFVAQDPLSLLPRGAVCEAVVSLECCMLLCLFVLAASGHTIFVVRMYAAPGLPAGAQEGYARERLLLAVLNALLTFSILALVRKIAVRWLRDAASFENAMGSAASLPVLAAAGDAGHGQASFRPAPSVGPYGQVALGACLSVCAGAEVYLLISAL